MTYEELRFSLLNQDEGDGMDDGDEEETEAPEEAGEEEETLGLDDEDL